MVVAILAEKPSAARGMAQALGGQKGTYNGEQYVVVHARGHLFELAPPEEQLISGGPDAAARIKQWNLDNLPWDESNLAFKRKPIKGTSDLIKTLKQALGAADEIAIATDLDPSGEGDAIAWNIIDELGLHGKQFSRMEFTDEAPASIQKAFTSRRKGITMLTEGNYLKADYRNKWDWLSMQFTRVATVCAAQASVLRQGRLKSAMVLLVGDQLKAYNSYVKVVRFQNRFRDENGVLYTNPAEPVFDREQDVPKHYSPSAVKLDSRQNKRTPPRRLLDLAGLSARLSGKGVKADVILATYQKMYEDQVVSYPRTEDKTITTEQFKEMLPLVDKIAAVVGVDPAILTERTPRKTHVKDSGAHGANRPGLKVPASLDALKAKYGTAAPLIYEELARSYLAMLAEDYVYEAQEGHVEAYPDFKGRASVPKSPGWKQVFQDAEDDDDTSASGLGQTASPIVYEVIPPRPEHPSMKWLMKQLEKRDVGTGATRTSTYAEVTSTKAKNSLLAETRGRITMTEVGEISYRMLPGTRIGDLSVTEQVFATMDRIAARQTTAAAELPQVADWVREDIETMGRNALSMRKELGLSEQRQQKEKFQGVWAKTGEQVSFNRETRGHRFTDAECVALLAGETISIVAKKNDGSGTYDCHGALANLEYNGHKYVGFDMLGFGKLSADGKPQPPSSWCGHTFTPEELQTLADGGKVFADDFVSKKSGKKYETTVRFGESGGSHRIIPSFADDF